MNLFQEMLPVATIMPSVKKYSFWLAVFLCITAVSCTNMECPLGNMVQVKCGIYGSDGKELTFTDTMTVRAAGTDQLLLNRAFSIKSFSVPLAYEAGVDTLLICLSDSKDRVAVDTLFVSHESSPHFESVDCPIVFFHNIREVSSANDVKSDFPIIIDHVELSRSLVNYDSDENIKLYLRSVSD